MLRACEIKRKNAVATIIDGISAIKTEPKAEQFKQPEQRYKQHLLSLARSKCLSEIWENTNRKFTKFTKRYNINEKSKTINHQTDRKHFKCFNCIQLGHISRVCTKPRIGCTISKRLGHTGHIYPQMHFHSSKILKCTLVNEIKTHYVMPSTHRYRMRRSNI